MASLRVMTSRGDKAVVWDPKRITDADVKAAVREAERIFAEERSKGATAFKVEPGKSAERIDSFDPKVEQTIVIVPRIGGG